jgi:hypothetical protein
MKNEELKSRSWRSDVVCFCVACLLLFSDKDWNFLSCNVLLKLLLLFGHTCVGKLLKLDVYQLYAILLKLGVPVYLMKRVLPFVPILLYLLLTYCAPMKKHQYQVQFQLHNPWSCTCAIQLSWWKRCTRLLLTPVLHKPNLHLLQHKFLILLVRTLYSSLRHLCTPQYLHM